MAGTAAGYPISTTPDVIRQFSDRPAPEMLDAIRIERRTLLHASVPRPYKDAFE